MCAVVIVVCVPSSFVDVGFVFVGVLLLLSAFVFLCVDGGCCLRVCVVVCVRFAIIVWGWLLCVCCGFMLCVFC